MRIDGGHVLLTGATGTVGTALTRRLRTAGARVTAVARTAADLHSLAATTGALRGVAARVPVRPVGGAAR